MTYPAEHPEGLVAKTAALIASRFSVPPDRAYLDELEHRFNTRNNEFIFRDTLTKLARATKLPYSELVKAA
jgi:hypothetical protein